MNAPHSHCHYCGTEHQDHSSHPTCPGCGEICWINPVPVAVCLTEIIGHNGQKGILLVDRALRPQGWALPGGFMERGEDVGEAALRELFEETGLRPSSGETEVVGAASVPGGTSVIIYVRTAPIREKDLKGFQTNSETHGVQAVFDLEEIERAQIVFPMHDQKARWFLGELNS